MWKPDRLKEILVIWALTAALASCSAISGRETAGEYVDDATITTKVKTAIITDPVLKTKAIQINVETFQKIVQLSGFVDSPQDSTRAADVASKVEGVREIKNNIVVR